MDGIHFETKDRMKVWWEAEQISIAGRSTNQIIDHWCEYYIVQVHLSFENDFNTYVIILC